MPYITFEQAAQELFEARPDIAEAYLEVAFEVYEQDGHSGALLEALRQVAEAKGGIPALAKRTGMTKQNLYRVLSAKGNPRLDTIYKLLKGLGYRITLEPLNEASDEVLAKPRKKKPLAEAKGVSV
jgi:probable addiction module antidote protein